MIRITLSVLCFWMSHLHSSAQSGSRRESTPSAQRSSEPAWVLSSQGVKTAYPVGSSIEITTITINKSSETRGFHGSGTISDYRITVNGPDGQSVPISGKIERTNSEVITEKGTFLQPKKSYAEKLILTDYFDMKALGEYRILIARNCKFPIVIRNNKPIFESESATKPCEIIIRVTAKPNPPIKK